MKAYHRWRQRFSIQLPQGGPRTEMEGIFEELKKWCESPPVRKRPANKWISNCTWALVDNRAMLPMKGNILQRGGRILGRRIKASLKADIEQRAADVGQRIETLLNDGDLEEVWRSLKCSYHLGEDRAPKP